MNEVPSLHRVFIENDRSNQALLILGRVAPNVSAGDPNEQREEEWERKEEGKGRQVVGRMERRP